VHHACMEKIATPARGWGSVCAAGPGHTDDAVCVCGACYDKPAAKALVRGEDVVNMSQVWRCPRRETCRMPLPNLSDSGMQLTTRAFQLRSCRADGLLIVVEARPQLPPQTAPASPFSRPPHILDNSIYHNIHHVSVVMPTVIGTIVIYVKALHPDMNPQLCYIIQSCRGP
jgi:hypothetical protein